jgi:hypothetical protein
MRQGHDAPSAAKSWEHLGVNGIAGIVEIFAVDLRFPWGRRAIIWAGVITANVLAYGRPVPFVFDRVPAGTDKEHQDGSK